MDNVPEEAWAMSKTLLQRSQDEELALNEIQDLGKSSEEIKEDVQNIKNWLLKEPHLQLTMEDLCILNVLRESKYQPEKVKQKLDCLYSLKNHMPDLFEDRDVMSSCIQTAMKCGYIVAMPKLTTDLNRITIFKILPDERDEFRLIDAVKLAFLTADIRILMDRRAGDIIILDYANLRLSHVVKTNPITIMRSQVYMLKSILARVKGVHFVNVPPYGHIFINTLKAVMKAKIAKRVFIHKNIKSLQEAVPKEFLPSDYGGTEKSLEELQIEWKTLLELMNDWVTIEGNKKSNESLRKEKLEGADILGLESTIKRFKKFETKCLTAVGHFFSRQ